MTNSCWCQTLLTLNSKLRKFDIIKHHVVLHVITTIYSQYTDGNSFLKISTSPKWNEHHWNKFFQTVLIRKPSRKLKSSAFASRQLQSEWTKKARQNERNMTTLSSVGSHKPKQLLLPHHQTADSSNCSGGFFKEKVRIINVKIKITIALIWRSSCYCER